MRDKVFSTSFHPRESDILRKFVRKFLLPAAALGLLAVAAVIATTPELMWRAQLIAMKAQGRVYDLSWGELLKMARPGSGYYLKDLVDSGNPYGVIKNIHASEKDVDAGSEIYRQKCSNCHGGAGAGGVGPALNTPDREHGDTDWALFRSVTRGIAGTAMTPQELPEREAWQVVAYMRSIEARDANLPMVEDAAFGEPVTYPRLLAGRQERQSWLTYSGDYDGKRYSELDQVNSDTVADLTLLWMRQTDASDVYLETSPIVNGGVMYVTVSPGSVVALDAATGEEIWTFQRALPEKLSLCCGTVNRGVALHGTTLYWGTLDAYLLAIDARSGKLIWEQNVADSDAGYTITSAPLAVKDLVLIGVSGGEYGIRGHLDAYHAESGERVWRFYTIPGPGEPGHETWSGDSWQRGGAGAWLTGSFDPTLNLVYWGTGNPSPLYNGDGRLGDNLYANSVVALDVDTGELRWHFQFTPHDLHDWAANQIPILADLEWDGEPQKLLLTANRNGFFYALDRTNGDYLHAKAFVRQNWAERIDETGRPVLRPEAIPTPEGTLTWPSPHGGTNWQSPAYSPVTGLFYVATLDGARVVYKQADTPKYTPGEFYLGSMHQLMSGDHRMVASLKALDPETGEIVWQYDNPPRRAMWRTGGVLATAGGIVIGGDNTALYALDAQSGDELWRLNVGGFINAAPMTYLAAGRQHITVAAGRSIMTFGLRDTEVPPQNTGGPREH